MKNLVGIGLAVSIAALFFSAVGCQSTGYGRTGSTVATMEELTAQIETGKGQIDAVLASLDKVSETASLDPRPAFQEFSKNISSLDSTATRARKRADSLRSQTSKHYEIWEKELQSMTAEDLRARAEERLAKARERFDELDQSLQELASAYEPFMAEVKDLRTFLENDLNPSGISAASNTIKKLNKSGGEVKKMADAAVAELTAIKEAVNPKQGELPEEK